MKSRVTTHRVYLHVFLLSTLWLAALTTSAASASGTTYYVDVNHRQAVDSSYHGSKERQETATGVVYHVAADGSADFTTIQEAADMAQPGDIVYVASGLYQEEIRLPRSGTADAPIVFQNAPGEQPVVQGYFRLTNIQYIWLIGFEITGSAIGTSIHIWGGGNHRIEGNKIHDTESDAGIHVTYSSYNTIYDNAVSYGGRGIALMAGCTYNIVDHNHTFMNDKSGEGADGIVSSGVDNHHNIISYNVIHDNADDGVDTWTGQYNLIVGNIAYHNGYMRDGEDGFDGNGFKLGSSQATGGGNLVVNNIAYNNRARGFTTNSGPLPNTLFNNVAYNNPEGFREFENSGGSTFRNNIAYANSRYDFRVASDSVLSHHLVSEDPLFADAANGDFHVSPNSPAIDAGTNLSQGDIPEVFLTDVPDFFRDEVLRQIEIDRDGIARPRGAAFDIGVYEYRETAPTVQSPIFLPFMSKSSLP